MITCLPKITKEGFVLAHSLLVHSKPHGRILRKLLTFHAARKQQGRWTWFCFISPFHAVQDQNPQCHLHKGQVFPCQLTYSRKVFIAISRNPSTLVIQSSGKLTVKNNHHHTPLKLDGLCDLSALTEDGSGLTS